VSTAVTVLAIVVTVIAVVGVTVAVDALLARAKAVRSLPPTPEPTALEARYRSSVLVSCKDGATFSGVLYSSDGQALVLRNSQAVGLGDNSTNLPLDGELIVLLADVAYLQKV
jgi:small nuclear ribonucleoprotein (snRNP)-like protein